MKVSISKISKEYLLPYRVENEPLDYWRDSISLLQKNLETYSTYYDKFSSFDLSNRKQISHFSIHVRQKIRNPI